jgi:hypothetical protein
MRKSFRLVPGLVPGGNVSLTLKMQPVPATSSEKSCSNDAPAPVLPTALTIFAVAGNKFTLGPLADNGVLFGQYDVDESRGLLLVLAGYLSGPVSWVVTPTLYPGYLQAAITPATHPQFARLNYWGTAPSSWGSTMTGPVTFSVVATSGGVSSPAFQLVVTDPGY